MNPETFEVNPEKAEDMARAADESHTLAAKWRREDPRAVETMADWNADMAERRAGMQHDIERLDLEQVRSRHAELERSIEELDKQQYDLFHQPQAARQSPEYKVHLEKITTLERQLLLLRMERGLVEKRLSL